MNSSSSLVEVIDRILDKGVVVDAWARVSLVGIEILSIEARVVIASVETFLKYGRACRAYGTRRNRSIIITLGKNSGGWNCSPSILLNSFPIQAPLIHQNNTIMS